MNDEIRNALESDLTIDITTIGRRSGSPRRIEIWFHNLDGRIIIIGSPGPRDWYANLLANPSMTFHLKETVIADLSGAARPIVEPEERRRFLDLLVPRMEEMSEWARGHGYDKWMTGSPLVEVTFDE
jgi:deazaflavin-dependent oxidoreductase (nitroreductase family)